MQVCKCECEQNCDSVKNEAWILSYYNPVSFFKTGEMFVHVERPARDPAYRSYTTELLQKQKKQKQNCTKSTPTHFLFSVRVNACVTAWLQSRQSQSIYCRKWMMSVLCAVCAHYVPLYESWVLVPGHIRKAPVWEALSAVAASVSSCLEFQSTHF